MIKRHNIGPISAAKSRLLLLGQCHCLHRSSAGPTTAAFFDCINLPTSAETWPSIGPIPSRKHVLAARVWARIGRQVHTGVIIPAMARYWQLIFGKFSPMLGQCWAVSNFALGLYNMNIWQTVHKYCKDYHLYCIQYQRKNIFTLKSVKFHWLIQWKIFFSVKSVNFH